MGTPREHAKWRGRLYMESVSATVPLHFSRECVDRSHGARHCVQRSVWLVVCTFGWLARVHPRGGWGRCKRFSRLGFIAKVTKRPRVGELPECITAFSRSPRPAYPADRVPDVEAGSLPIWLLTSKLRCRIRLKHRDRGPLKMTPPWPLPLAPSMPVRVCSSSAKGSTHAHSVPLSRVRLAYLPRVCRRGVHVSVYHGDL